MVIFPIRTLNLSKSIPNHTTNKIIHNFKKKRKTGMMPILKKIKLSHSNVFIYLHIFLAMQSFRFFIWQYNFLENNLKDIQIPSNAIYTDY